MEVAEYERLAIEMTSRRGRTADHLFWRAARSVRTCIALIPCEWNLATYEGHEEYIRRTIKHAIGTSKSPRCAGCCSIVEQQPSGRMLLLSTAESRNQVEI